jgi:hypothetical protein
LAGGDVSIFNRWLIYLISIEMITTMLVVFRHGNMVKWMGIQLISQFCYGYILVFWRAFSLFEEWASNEMTWDKLERTGNMNGETIRRTA